MQDTQMAVKVHVGEVLPPLSFVNWKAVASSRDVAETFGKEHQNILKAIRSILEDVPEEFAQVNFNLGGYQDGNFQERPMYQITKQGFELLVMSFTGKDAMQWKVRYIEAFNLMDEEIRRFEAAGIRFESTALVDALFAGQLSVFQAKRIQDFPEHQQEEILSLPKKEIARAIKELRKNSGVNAALAGFSGNNEWYTTSK